MGLIANDKGGVDFDPIAQGVHQAICYGLFDLGTQFSDKFGNWSHKILLCWEIPEERIQIEKDGKKTTRVRVGPFESRAEADKAAARIRKLDLPAHLITL